MGAKDQEQQMTLQLFTQTRRCGVHQDVFPPLSTLALRPRVEVVPVTTPSSNACGSACGCGCGRSSGSTSEAHCTVENAIVLSLQAFGNQSLDAEAPFVTADSVMNCLEVATDIRRSAKPNCVLGPDLMKLPPGLSPFGMSDNTTSPPPVLIIILFLKI